jgi:hypothetical protein
VNRPTTPIAASARPNPPALRELRLHPIVGATMLSHAGLDELVENRELAVLALRNAAPDPR